MRNNHASPTNRTRAAAPDAIRSSTFTGAIFVLGAAMTLFGCGQSAPQASPGPVSTVTASETTALAPPAAVKSDAASDTLLAGKAIESYVLHCFGDSGAKVGIEHLVLHGDSAVAVTTILSVPELAGEHSLVLMNRVKGAWIGQDYGSGLEAPEWYTHW